MSIVNDVLNVKNDVEQIKKDLVKPEKEKKFKFPFQFNMRLKKSVKQGKFLTILMRNNKSIEFKFCSLVAGCLDVEGIGIISLYNSDAVYRYKNLPVIVILENRVLPVGGFVERLNKEEIDELLIGGNRTKELSEKLGLYDFKSELAITKFELKEANLLSGVKGKINYLVWLLIAGAIIYVVASMGGFI